MADKIKTAAELAERAIDVARNYKTLYIMGCFGAPMTAANKTRYTKNYSYNRNAVRTRMINAADDDTFGFDCVCLIKGLLWGWTGDKRHIYGGAKYATNGVPDIGADAMITKCSAISTDFSKIEIGEAVWTSGHVGIYVGDGLAVECTPKWANDVQITACNCAKSGFHQRNWKKHGKLPYVAYTGKYESVKGNTSAAKPHTSASVSGRFKVGDVVNFTGTKHYVSANAATGPDCAPGKARITAVYKDGKRPYHLIAVSGGGSNVYGWVNAADVSGTASASGNNRTYTVKRGDCLWDIAAKKLGDGNRYPEIKRLNGLTSDTIYTGQILKLPN